MQQQIVRRGSRPPARGSRASASSRRAIRGLDEDVRFESGLSQHALNAEHFVADRITVAERGQHLMDRRRGVPRFMRRPDGDCSATARDADRAGDAGSAGGAEDRGRGGGGATTVIAERGLAFRPQRSAVPLSSTGPTGSRPARPSPDGTPVVAARTSRARRPRSSPPTISTADRSCRDTSARSPANRSDRDRTAARFFRATAFSHRVRSSARSVSTNS